MLFLERSNALILQSMSCHRAAHLRKGWQKSCINLWAAILQQSGKVKSQTACEQAGKMRARYRNHQKCREAEHAGNFSRYIAHSVVIWLWSLLRNGCNAPSNCKQLPIRQLGQKFLIPPYDDEGNGQLWSVLCVKFLNASLQSHKVWCRAEKNLLNWVQALMMQSLPRFTRTCLESTDLHRRSNSSFCQLHKVISYEASDCQRWKWFEQKLDQLNYYGIPGWTGRRKLGG